MKGAGLQILAAQPHQCHTKAEAEATVETAILSLDQMSTLPIAIRRHGLELSMRRAQPVISRFNNNRRTVRILEILLDNTRLAKISSGDHWSSC